MNPTVRQQQTDAPELLVPARAMALREAGRRQARISAEQSGQVPLPVPVPPSMQPGQPVPQLVSAETLDQLTQLMTERITHGDTELARRIEQLAAGRESRYQGNVFTDQDLALRLQALSAARDYVSRHLRASGEKLDLGSRLDLELDVAKFLLDQE